MDRIKGVLLDVDGTLVDSNDQHALAWAEALRRGGHDVTYDRIRSLVGMGGDNLVPAATGLDPRSPELKQLSAYWKQIFTGTYLPTVRAFPDAHNLLLKMKRSGLKLVVASSAEEDVLERLLSLVGTQGLLEETTSADDAESSKPDPDIIQAALDRIKLPADQVLMLGDTPYDIEACEKAGVGVVAFRCGGWDDGGLRGALAIYDDPADLLRNFNTSPFAT